MFPLRKLKLILVKNITLLLVKWKLAPEREGRCKSTFHQFLTDIMESVQTRAATRGLKQKTIFLPHCTWDKMGEIMANSGGRCFGLFDELLSFFSTMNMYSSVKMQVSDTREYQDFLQMYNGKSKTRETVTGNANYRMAQTSFTMVGFTQPQAALPIIEDVQNNAKGFTSRLLWYFPEPIFCRMRDTMLTDEEATLVREYRQQLVDFLTELYIDGEETYMEEVNNKMITVVVERKKYDLSPAARKHFEDIHDDWEMSVCEKYPHDALVGGLYSRGKSQVLRLAVPIEILLSLWNDDVEDEPVADKRTDFLDNDKNQAEEGVNPDKDENVDERDEESAGNTSESDDESGEADENAHRTPEPVLIIGEEAIKIAHSIVKTCLSQLCTLSDKMYVIKGQEDCDEAEGSAIENEPSTSIQHFGKLYTAVLLSHGQITSLTVLNQRSKFRKPVAGYSNKDLMMKVLADLSSLGLGEIEQFTIPGNKCKVLFFKKKPIPDEPDELKKFVRTLAKVGIDLRKYKMAYETEDENSEQHQTDYTHRKNNHSTPSKKRKHDES